MTFSRICLMLFLVLASAGLRAAGDEPDSGPTTIPLDSEEGRRLLGGADDVRAYKILSSSRYYSPQINGSYCGVASSVTVLNALSIKKPMDAGNFDQSSFFSDKRAAAVVSERTVLDHGMTLDELGQILKIYTASVEVTHGSDIVLAEFRERFKRALREPGCFVLINYLRPAVGQTGGGHISPCVAYHPGTDRFLILDVNEKRPRVWVKAETLLKAMATIDGVSHKSRGFVIVRGKIANPS